MKRKRKPLRMRLRHRIEQWLIRHGVITTPQEDEYLSWADERLDQLAKEAERAKQDA